LNLDKVEAKPGQKRPDLGKIETSHPQKHSSSTVTLVRLIKVFWWTSGKYLKDLVDQNQCKPIVLFEVIISPEKIFDWEKER